MAAGATSLEHAIDLDNATLAAMKSRGVFYVPTIDHNRYYAEYAKDFRYTPQQVAELLLGSVSHELSHRCRRPVVLISAGQEAVRVSQPAAVASEA